jgi:hypothetical protein
MKHLLHRSKLTMLTMALACGLAVSAAMPAAHAAAHPAAGVSALARPGSPYYPPGPC